MRVVSYGGGTNSTAMLIDLVFKKEKIDLILFADTGAEKPHTYHYVELFSKWLTENGYPGIIIVKGNVTLEEDCLKRQALPSLAYGFKTCSQRFKLQPQEKYLNNWEPATNAWKKGEVVTKLIDYDADESRRAKDYSDSKFTLQYPLIERGWGRDECIKAIEKAGLPLPGKSSCFFCPSMKKHEIFKLKKDYPELLERALRLESNADLTTIKGLGRDYAWSDLIRAESDQMKMFCDVIDENCNCYDG